MKVRGGEKGSEQGVAVEGEVETGRGHVCVQLRGAAGSQIYDLITSLLEDRSSNRTGSLISPHCTVFIVC